MGITVTFDHLDLLSPEELRAGIAVFTAARDGFAREGRAGLADLFATVLVALVEERDRRRKQWHRTQRALVFDDPNEADDAEWGERC